MVDSSIEAAQALHSKIGAHIIMLLVDSQKHNDHRLAQFEVYDYSMLFLPKKPTASASASGPVKRTGRMRGVGKYILRSRFGTFILQSAKRSEKAHQKTDPGAVPLKARLRRYLRSTFVGNAIVREYFTRLGLAAIRKMLDRVQPDAIVVLEDNIQTPSRFVVEEGRRRGLPTIILPFTIPNPKEAAQFYSGDRSYLINNQLKRAFASLRPKWRHEHEGTAMLRLPIDQAITHELRGLATEKPWILNFGPASAIALESAAMRAAYVRLGFPKDVLKVVGEPVGEVLHRGLIEREARRSALCSEHALDPSRLLIVCAFPPDQFNSKDRSRFEYDSFDSLIEGWIGTFSGIGNRANVLIRPHPRLDPVRLLRHAGKNIRVTMARTAELVPLCDIYVASISATIRWAIASGVPVVNYDCYRYRYDDFASVNAVVAVESRPAFTDVLNRMADDETYLASLRASQLGVMSYWGIADDQFGQRFAQVAEELLMDWQK